MHQDGRHDDTRYSNDQSQQKLEKDKDEERNQCSEKLENAYHWPTANDRQPFDLLLELQLIVPAMLVEQFQEVWVENRLE
jgi:hypothetical protein